MKTLNSIFFFIIVSPALLFSQSNNLDTWTIGTGASNFIMHGDLGSKDANLGYYIYLNKMVSPAFGFELKGQIQKISGSSQKNSSPLPVLFTSIPSNNLKFSGDSFGGEFNLVLNLNGLRTNSDKDRKFNLASYFGIGYHTYSTKLYNETTDDLLIDFSASQSGGDSKSIYYTSGLGLKYKLSNRFDLELRQTVNFNNEDHLDAAISSKQNFETFFTTQIGVVIKLHRKGNENISWQNNFDQNDAIIEEIVEKPEIKFTDTDGDGVIDQFDKEPNTDKNALVYANGVTIDSDKDGVPDHLDKCPLEAGNDKDGCNGNAPTQQVITKVETVDTDKDGIPDSLDKCPLVYATTNNGCPEIAKPIKKEVIATIIPSKPKKEIKNIEAIKKINKNSLKHNIYELDNAVSSMNIDKLPVYPGCENKTSKFEMGNCLISKINLYSLDHFKTDSFTDLNLSKGVHTIRIIFVIDQNGNSKAFKTIGKWDDKVIREASRVIESIPVVKPGLLNNVPTPVKFNTKISFTVE